MAKFCENCGKEISEGLAFCPECGVAVQVGQTAPQAKDEPVSKPTPPPASQTAKQRADNNQLPKGQYGVVGTGTYFGLTFIFAIPIIGWIICAVMAFKSKNENKKHFAKAMLIWLIICIILSIVGFFIVRWIGNSLTEYINEITGGQIGDLQDLLEQFNQFEDSGSALPTN